MIDCLNTEPATLKLPAMLTFDFIDSVAIVNQLKSRPEPPSEELLLGTDCFGINFRRAEASVTEPFLQEGERHTSL